MKIDKDNAITSSEIHLFQEEEEFFHCILALSLGGGVGDDTVVTSLAVSNKNDDNNNNNDEQHQQQDAIKYNNKNDSSMISKYTTTTTTTTPTKALQRIRTICDKYLECPTLLDSSLEKIIHRLTEPALYCLQTTSQQQQQQQQKHDNDKCTATSTSINESMIKTNDQCLVHILMHHLSAIYALSKVRGRKCIQRFLPHAVHDLEPIWNGLQTMLVGLYDHHQQQHPSRHEGKVEDEKNDMTIMISTTSTENGAPVLWESIYILWNWLSVLSLVPFDCSVIMSPEFISNLYHTCQRHLSEAGPTREAAAYCLANWLSRPDIESYYVPYFVQWSQTDIILPILLSYTTNQSSSSSISSTNTLFNILGILQTLTSILKVSSTDRRILVMYMKPLWTNFLSLSESTYAVNHVLLHKWLVKWWTRMSCTYLPPRIASWRYQRGQRSLVDNLHHHPARQHPYQNTIGSHPINNPNDILLRHNEKSSTQEIEQQQDDILFHVADEVEEAMGRVIEALGHSSTVVRWSAAKGVGRISERLPALCADDVLDAILEHFTDPDNDRRWHGACLALAEMARRGLLLPNRIDNVVPYIVRAVHFDIRTTRSSIGAHVRDAACYVYWAFTRSYHPSILRPYISELSESIVLASLFDREVNCRRAASAAFQEAVGRQGSAQFPNGIAILTAADFYSLGSRSNAYTMIAWKVAAFEEFRRPIIRHLYTFKLFHWDIQVRTLVSQSLSGLVSLDVPYICATVFPYLLEQALDEKNLEVRHGAVLAVAELTLALANIGMLSKLSSIVMDKLTGLVAAIEKKRLYRGRGGEIMRSAVCRLVECLSIAQLPLTVAQQVCLLDSIESCIPHPSEVIQKDACVALKSLMISYFPVGENGPSERLQNRVVNKFINIASTSENPAAVRGYTLSLSYLPRRLLAPSISVLQNVVSCLCKIAHHQSLVGGESDAETRRNALFSLRRISETIGVIDESLSSPYPSVSIDQTIIEKLFDTYLTALEDYKSDRRGDVGSWCRMSAIEGILNLVKLSLQSVETADILTTTKLPTKLVGALMKQLAEKLDTVRQCAGLALHDILLSRDMDTISIVKKGELIHALGIAREAPESRNWYDPSYTFPRVMEAASITDSDHIYADNVVMGIVISIGCLTEAVSRCASSALLEWVRRGDLRRREYVGNLLLEQLQRNRGTSRLVLPLLKAMDMLLVHRCMDDFVQRVGSFSETCLRMLEQEELICNDVQRLLMIVNVSVSLLNASLPNHPTGKNFLCFLCSLLIHRYPRVRTHAAQQIYLCLLEHYNYAESDKALDILLNTPWASHPHFEQCIALADMLEFGGTLESRIPELGRCRSRD